MSRGAFTVSHPNSASTFSFKANPDTCAYPVKGNGSCTLGAGAQAYKHLTGSGAVRALGHGVAARNDDGSCAFDGQPVAETFVRQGHGPASFSGDEG